jgi:hypothetical protein
MDLDKRNAWAEFFASYNQALGSYFDTELDGIDDEEILDAPGFDEAIRNSVLNSMQSWYAQPMENAGGVTPERMIEDICTLDEAMEVFLLASTQCDEELPDLLRVKLGAYGVRAVDRLLPMVFSAPWESQEETAGDRPDEMLASAAALRLLGEWGASDTLELVLSRYIATDNPDEMISEAFVTYCTGIGEFAITHLSSALLQDAAAGGNLSGPFEYVVIALTETGRTHPSDSVFLCLRECFRKMEHRVIGAICLGDYGDGRAIPALKGFLDRHVEQVDRQLFYEILSSIKRLGGDISDIHDPFGDFAGQKKNPSQ